jgi:hypothetical protein
LKKKLALISLLTLGMGLMVTGCSSEEEFPAAGVSIENAEGQTLGFTYLYDLGGGYKLYADNFTKIVYLRYDYQSGDGATSIGSSSLSPYISPNGYYYKVNTTTRVIEEYIPSNTSSSVAVTDTDVTITDETTTSSNNKSDIEAILNENGQKNQNSNNQQQQEANNASTQYSQNPEDNTSDNSTQQSGAISYTVEESSTEEAATEEAVTQ